MPTPSQQPTLLIITSETSEAERLMAVLREARLAERSLSIPNAEHLDRVIAERSCDLILCCGYDRDVEVDTILTTYKRLKTDIPLILLADPEQWETLAGKARRAGARDIVRRADPEHLRLSLGRELADWKARRTAGALDTRLRQCEQNTLRLTEITGAGVAFVQDGLHIEVDDTYARLFGHASTDEVLATPLLDLIAPEHHAAIRDLLKASDPADPGGATLLDVTCRRAGATRFQARLLASPSEFEGEPCLRSDLPADRDGREGRDGRGASRRPAWGGWTRGPDRRDRIPHRRTASRHPSLRHLLHPRRQDSRRDA
ncbi:MAG: hypothetical protein MZV65_50250 [Chromatiales bacterium]|nr:hypothetical protein [Chromatiales bacterium]